MLTKQIKCSVENCLNNIFCRNLCKAHYHKLQRYGTPYGGQKRIIKCSVFDCGRYHYGKGYCQKHYIRFKKNGDPLICKKKKITPNNIIYTDDKTIKMELTKNYYCLLDASKYDIVKKYRWSAQCRKNNPAVYAIASKMVNGKKQYFRMSRLIMDCSIDKEVDHIHGSNTTLDNRTHNLRIVNNSQNSRNRSLISKSSTGYKNIYAYV